MDDFEKNDITAAPAESAEAGVSGKAEEAFIEARNAVKRAEDAVIEARSAVADAENAAKAEKSGKAKKEKGSKKLLKLKGKKKAAVIIAAVLLVIIVGARLMGHKKTIVTEALPTVSAVKPETADIIIETSLVGTVMPGEVYYMTPKSAGEITAIFVKQGDEVKAGDPICALDCSKQIDSAQISLDGAKVQTANAENTMKLAQTNLERMRVLYSSGDISRQAFESAENSYNQAKAGYEAAKLQLDGAQLQYDTNLEYSTVTSPCDGVIESADMTINAMASQATVLAVVSSKGERQIEFSITDRLLDCLKSGSAIRAAKQGTAFDAVVESVSTIPDNQTGMYRVKAGFKDNPGIPNGSKVKVIFTSEKTEGALTVPTEAVYYDGGKTYVYTLTYIGGAADGGAAGGNGGTAGTGGQDGGAAGAAGGDTAANAGAAGAAALDGAARAGTEILIHENNAAAIVHRNEVSIGLSDRERTEILEGIDKDSLVICSWTSQLYEGARVQALNAEVQQ